MRAGRGGTTRDRGQLRQEHILFGRTITGIVEGDSVAEVFIQSLIELHRQGRFPFDRLIRFYAPDDINQPAEDWLAGTTLKPVLPMRATQLLGGQAALVKHTALR